MFDSWDKGSQMVLKKNPSYWDEVKPYLDAMTFKVLTDSNARVLQLQGGELDIATDRAVQPDRTARRANPDFTPRAGRGRQDRLHRSQSAAPPAG